jgi:hypothetical protein
VDKISLADNIRRHLERRIALLLGVKPEELPKLKLGTLVHLLFAFCGDSEEIGGFRTTIQGVLQLVGHEVVWADPTETVDEEPNSEEKVVVN